MEKMKKGQRGKSTGGNGIVKKNKNNWKTFRIVPTISTYIT